MSNLGSLFEPQTVAVIGASRTPGKVGHAVMANLIEAGFGGRILPVNPGTAEIMGLPALTNARDYAGQIDLSVIAVPVPAVRDAVEDSLRAGARSVVVLTAGFREVGPEGAAREAELVELCRSHGARMLGPNCLGVINTHHRFNATFAQGLPAAGYLRRLPVGGPPRCSPRLGGRAAPGARQAGLDREQGRPERDRSARRTGRGRPDQGGGGLPGEHHFGGRIRARGRAGGLGEALDRAQGGHERRRHPGGLLPYRQPGRSGYRLRCGLPPSRGDPGGYLRGDHRLRDRACHPAAPARGPGGHQHQRGGSGDHGGRRRGARRPAGGFAGRLHCDGVEVQAVSRQTGYYLDPRTNRSEVAFLVADEWQNRGVGTFLLRHLIRIAKRNGIAGFYGEALRENQAMQAVLRKSGCKMQSRYEDGVFYFEIDFS